MYIMCVYIYIYMFLLLILMIIIIVIMIDNNTYVSLLHKAAARSRGLTSRTMRASAWGSRPTAPYAILYYSVLYYIIIDCTTMV